MKCVCIRLVSAWDITGHQPVAMHLVWNCIVCKYWRLHRTVISVFAWNEILPWSRRQRLFFYRECLCNYQTVRRCCSQGPNFVEMMDECVFCPCSLLLHYFSFPALVTFLMSLSHVFVWKLFCHFHLYFASFLLSLSAFPPIFFHVFLSSLYYSYFFLIFLSSLLFHGLR